MVPYLKRIRLQLPRPARALQYSFGSSRLSCRAAQSQCLLTATSRAAAQSAALQASQAAEVVIPVPIVALTQASEVVPALQIWTAALTAASEVVAASPASPSVPVASLLGDAARPSPLAARRWSRWSTVHPWSARPMIPPQTSPARTARAAPRLGKVGLLQSHPHHGFPP